MGLHIPPALYHRRFRALWLGLMISTAGSAMQLAAIHWHLRDLTAEPIAVGGIGLARFLPIFLFALIGGATADVANRRKIMFLTQSAMALIALLLSWLTFSGHITLWHLYTLTALQAIATSFDLPARQSLVPNLVPAADLPNAFSLQSIAFQTGSIVGPALSGLVISRGLGYVYLINAISFLAVILALVDIGEVQQKFQRQARGAAQRPGISFKAITEGIQFIASHPLILSTMILDFIATFFSSATTMLPFFVRDVLHLGETEYGYLASAESLGAMLAALVISQLPQLRRQGPLFLTCVLIFGLATLSFGLSTTFGMAMLSLTMVGAADSVSAIIRNTIRQLQTPDHIRGRMVSVNQIFFMGGPQLGEIEAGLMAQWRGVPFSIVTGGMGCILAVLLIARKWPQLRSYNGDEPSVAGAQGAAA